MRDCRPVTPAASTADQSIAPSAVHLVRVGPNVLNSRPGQLLHLPVLPQLWEPTTDVPLVGQSL